MARSCSNSEKNTSSPCESRSPGWVSRPARIPRLPWQSGQRPMSSRRSHSLANRQSRFTHATGCPNQTPPIRNSWCRSTKDMWGGENSSAASATVERRRDAREGSAVQVVADGAVREAVAVVRDEARASVTLAPRWQPPRRGARPTRGRSAHAVVAAHRRRRAPGSRRVSDSCCAAGRRAVSSRLRSGPHHRHGSNAADSARRLVSLGRRRNHASLRPECRPCCGRCADGGRALPGDPAVTRRAGDRVELRMDCRASLPFGIRGRGRLAFGESRAFGEATVDPASVADFGSRTRDFAFALDFILLRSRWSTRVDGYAWARLGIHREAPPWRCSRALRSVSTP